MKNVDFGAVIVGYNFVIGILLILASEKTASFVGALAMGSKNTVERYTNVVLKAFGASIAVLSGSIYLLWHVFRVGLD